MFAVSRKSLRYLLIHWSFKVAQPDALADRGQLDMEISMLGFVGHSKTQKKQAYMHRHYDLLFN